MKNIKYIFVSLIAAALVFLGAIIYTNNRSKVHEEDAKISTENGISSEKTAIQIKKLYVGFDGVQLFELTDDKTEPIATLNKGHELLEINEKNGWVEVGVAMYDGLSGWVLKENVTEDFVGGKTTAKYNQKFDLFAQNFEELNERIESQYGIQLFINAEYLGDGIIQVTATDGWVNTSDEDAKISNLNTIFSLWEAADGTGLPIAVQIVNEAGEIILKKSSLINQ